MKSVGALSPLIAVNCLSIRECEQNVNPPRFLGEGG